MLVGAASALTFHVQKQKHKALADHLVKAPIEDWNMRKGGATESMELRKKALISCIGIYRWSSH